MIIYFEPLKYKLARISMGEVKPESFPILTPILKWDPEIVEEGADDSSDEEAASPEKAKKIINPFDPDEQIKYSAQFTPLYGGLELVLRIATWISKGSVAKKMRLLDKSPNKAKIIEDETADPNLEDLFMAWIAQYHPEYKTKKIEKLWEEIEGSEGIFFEQEFQKVINKKWMPASKLWFASTTTAPIILKKVKVTWTELEEVLPYVAKK